MIALYIAPFFIAFITFVFIRTMRYLRSAGLSLFVWVFGFLLYGGMLSSVIGFLLPAVSALKRPLTRVGFYWLGVILYFFLSLFFSLAVRFLFRKILKERYDLTKARHLTAVFVIVFTIGMSIYGIVNAHDLHVTEYEVSIDKESRLDELNIVLIADTHLGYNITVSQVEDMVEKINAQHPDIVLIAGDIFDNDYEAIEDPERMIDLFNDIRSTYGTYAVWGNHDIEEKIFFGFTFSGKKAVSCDERMLEFLRRADIELLYDQWLEIEDVLIYGRPDRQKINMGNSSRKSVEEFMEGIDVSRPIIVLDHQPSDARELSRYGVDLYLNGHTHDGQMWPGTMTIHLFWDHPYGLRKYGDLYDIVTSGVGLFGPNMRTDSIAEICSIKVTFR